MCRGCFASLKRSEDQTNLITPGPKLKPTSGESVRAREEGHGKPVTRDITAVLTPPKAAQTIIPDVNTDKTRKEAQEDEFWGSTYGQKQR